MVRAPKAWTATAALPDEPVTAEATEVTKSEQPIAGDTCYRNSDGWERFSYVCWATPPSTTGTASTGATSGSTTTGSGTDTGSTTSTGSTTTGTASTTGSETTTDTGSTSSDSGATTGSESTSAATATSGSTTEPDGDPGSWNLIFDDEFTNDSSLNTSDWTPEWFTDGATQNGTAMESSNVSVSGGDLDLNLTPDSGAIVTTNGKFSYTYGFAQAEIYLPPSTSGSEIANWPGFWTDGQSWPADGEQDIMEGLGGQACYHFHWEASNGEGSAGGCASGNYTGWHTFGADWEPGSITYYYDGQKVGTVDQGITSSPMYLVLEDSLSGSDGGPSVLPSTMKVAYVRVWQH